MPDPNRKIERDPVAFSERPRFTQADMDAFIDLPYCNQCICAGYTLTELINIAKERDLTYEQVMTLTGAGSECEVCVPYIKRAVETGENQIFINPRDTHMHIHKDGILEKEPPKLPKNLLDPSRVDPVSSARLKALAADDKVDEATIKTDIE